MQRRCSRASRRFFLNLENDGGTGLRPLDEDRRGADLHDVACLERRPAAPSAVHPQACTAASLNPQHSGMGFDNGVP